MVDMRGPRTKHLVGRPVHIGGYRETAAASNCHAGRLMFQSASALIAIARA